MPKNVAVLWDAEVDWKGDKPFKKDHISTSYEYFSDLARGKDAKVFIAKYEWFQRGELKKAYRFNGDEWQKVEKTDVDVVFDKYKFDDDTIEMKEWIEENLPVLNQLEVEKICKDKMLTYQKFPEKHPETRRMTEENVSEMIEKYEKVVVKPLAAHAGRGVKVIDDISELGSIREGIVQRFIDSSGGIEGLGVEGVHDLRVVVVNGDPVVSYTRQPDSGLVSNVSRGGSMEFFPVEEVPEEAMEVVGRVVEEFEGFKPFVCGVDMIFDEEQQPWVLELNSKPGMSFYEDEEVKNWKKPYIEEVVKTLAGMD